MTKVLVTEQSLYDIADAIRVKIGVEDTYTPGEMAGAIEGIPSVTAADNGKVVVDGALVAQTSLSVTQNGTYDTTTNDEVIVNVSGGGGSTIQPLSVTQNGIYTPPSGVDGYAPVTVNVSGGGTSDNDLLFHFADFKNSGKMDAVFYTTTGYEISEEQSKFGGTSLKVSSSPSTNGSVYLPSGFTIGSEDFTMDLWVYQTSTASSSCLVSFNYRTFGYYSSNGTTRGLGVTTSTGSWSISHTSQVKSLNILNGWHHLAITRENGTTRVFVDGAEEDSFSFAGSFPSMTRLSFGTNSSADYTWRGYIDEFRLKLGEAVWTEDFTPPTQPYE